VLINNIAYLLRKFPIFAVPGSGEYRLQPIYVEDMADLCVKYGYAQDDVILDAVGPQVFAFNELLHLIAEKIGRRVWLVNLPPSLALSLSRAVGLFLGDMVLTRDELSGLSANLLISAQPPTGQTRLGDWLAANPEKVGQRYHSEIQRHYSSTDSPSL